MKGSDMAQEKRRFSRIPFRIEAEMMADDELYRSGEVINLGVGGCLLPITGEFKPGTACHLKFMLSGASSELSIRVEGEIIRRKPGAVAVKFTQIDPDSLFHLQNIIRYNSQDPEAVEQEIHEHPGLL